MAKKEDLRLPPPPVDPEKLKEFRQGFNSDSDKVKEMLKNLLRKKADGK